MNWEIIFWAFFGLTVLVFIVNGVAMPFIRKKMDAKAQDKQELILEKIKKGDKVLLVSGIYGYIVSIHKRTFEVKISENNTIIRVDKEGIMGFFDPKDRDKTISKKNKENKSK